MVTKAKLSVDVSTNTGQFESGLKRADRAMQNSQRTWDRSLRASGRSFDLLTKKLFNFESALGGVVSGAGLAAFARSTLNAADRIQDLSDRLGLSTKDVQVYTQFLNLAGVSAEQFEVAATKINNRIASGEIGYANTSEALRVMAERIGNAKTSQEAFGIAAEFVGEKMTGKFVGAFKGGAAAVDEFSKKQQQLGGIIDEATIARAAAYNDQLDNFFMLLRANASEGFLSGLVKDGESLSNAFSPKMAENVQYVANAFGNLIRVIVENGEAALAILAAIAVRMAPVTAAITAAVVAGNHLGRFAAKFDFMQKSSRRKQYGSADPSLDISMADIEARLATPATAPASKSPTIANTAARIQNAASIKKQSDNQRTLNQQIKEGSSYANELGLTFSSAFEDAIVGGQKLGDVLKGLAQDIIRMTIRQTVTEPASNAIRGLFSGGGGFGGIFGSIGTSLFGSSPASGIGPVMPGLFDGFFADGGFIKPGHWGIAGEAGMEPVFGGRTGASVVSNKDLGGGGGNNFYIDARGADSGQIRMLEAKLQAMAGKGVVEQRVVEAMQRGKI